MTSDEVRKLYDYNKWANRRIVECCRPIDSSAFTKNLGNSFSSLRDTLAHIIGAEWVWLERWQRRSPKKLLASEEFPDLASVVRTRFSPNSRMS